MKRHPALEPFSRDHNVGLILARELMRGDVGVGEKLAAVWQDEMRDHFEMEEQLLGPLLCASSAARLTEEHRRFTDLVGQLSSTPQERDVLKQAGALLDAHIRWEERELFPEIEQSATSEQLQNLARATDEIENRRADSKWAPRRGELMAKRKTTCDSFLRSGERLTGPLWATETEDLDCTLLQWNAGHQIAPHVNDEVDVVMTVLQGSGTIEIDGVKTLLKAGVIVVIPKGTRRSIDAESTPLVYLNVHKRRRRLMPQAGRPAR